MRFAAFIALLVLLCSGPSRLDAQRPQASHSTTSAASVTDSAVTRIVQPSASQPVTVHPFAPEGEFKGFRYLQPHQLRRPKVGLVLSGGGARGLSQIGALKVLEEHQIPIDLIVGTSLGSVIGGLYAAGYTTAQLESIATHANWDELLSFGEPSSRRDLLLAQKQTQAAGYLSVRFDGLQPVIPQSISGGQHITNFFMNLTLQALYHPDSTFDDLKIPFRSIATDLYHGTRVILDRGSLAEAMRASVTVPFLYTPLEKDSMALVDGGLLSNVPVDVARKMGCDIVVVLNSASDIEEAGPFNAPWEVADQIMTIMMQSANKAQLANADVVITPNPGHHAVSDFSGIDTLIRCGAIAAEEKVDSLAALLKRKTVPEGGAPARSYPVATLAFNGPVVGRIRTTLESNASDGMLTSRDLDDAIEDLYETGEIADASYTVREQPGGGNAITVSAQANRNVAGVAVAGVMSIPSASVDTIVAPLVGKPLNTFALAGALRNILERYRAEQYSLARIDSVRIDTGSGAVNIFLSEGVLADIKYEGNEQTKDYVIRRELPYDAGTVFNLNKVYEGMVNVTSTGLFDYTLLDVRYTSDRKPYVVLKVKEKPSEAMLIGLHGDNEHGIVGTVSAADANFRGAGDELGLLLRYGLRDREVRLGYHANRIFRTYLTFDLRGYFRSREVFTYQDDPNQSDTRWERIEAGRYRENRYGGTFSFGTQVERFGLVSADLRASHHRIDSLGGTGFTTDSYNIVALKLQSTIDTEDKFTFPTKGLYLNAYYEAANKSFFSEVAFSKLGLTYESFHTFAQRHTFHPKVTFGFADQTLPIIEQYRLGGYNSFFGLWEDDSRGRQLFLVNFEYRFKTPFRLLFDTYLGVRYDLGTISAVPEELKLNTFRHGIGATLNLDTPLGAASFGAGFSFYFKRNIPNQPIAYGPPLFYFSIGPGL